MKKGILSLSVALWLSLVSSAARSDDFAGWTYANHSLSPFVRPSVNPFSDGSVLIVGAASSNGEAQEYSSATGSWISVGQPLFPRVLHAAVSLPGDKVLLCGGGRFVSNFKFETSPPGAEVYDHATRTFTQAGGTGERRILLTATLSCDERTEPLVLVTGGGVNSIDYVHDAPFYDSAQIYRLSAGQWEAAPPMSTGRGLHTATCIPGRGVLVVGGLSDHHSKSSVLASAELFDPATRTWKTVASLRTARCAHTAMLLPGGKVLVAGGFPGRPDDAPPLPSVELYDPETDQWTELPDMSVGRSFHAQLALPNDRVLLAGGFTTAMSGITASVDLYEPTPGAGLSGSAELRRVPFPSMVLARADFGLALLGGDTVFAAGDHSPSSTAEVLTLSREGAPCERSFECQSGFCVDGVCCNGACDASCSVCSAESGSPADGVCAELSCPNHLACVRPFGSAPQCPKDPTCESGPPCPDKVTCESADQCEVGYACEPASQTCVEPHSTFVSEGCSVSAPGGPSSGRPDWLFLSLLLLLAPIARRASVARRARRVTSLSLPALALLTAGCDMSGEDALCAPFAMCGDQCVNLRVDRQSCGGCGIACESAELCIDGKCTLECAGGSFKCPGGRCVDLSVDPSSCGACDAKCAGGQICDHGVCALPQGLRSYIFPGGSAEGGVHAVEPRYVLVADAPATIHYTTDGSTPVPGQPATTSRKSPITIPPSNEPGVSQRRIQWFADYDLLGPEAEVHSYLSVIEPASQINFGALVDAPKLSPGGAPLIVVPPGGDVQGTVDFVEWSSKDQGYCPSCIIQLYLDLQSTTTTTTTFGCDSFQEVKYPGKERTFTLKRKAPLSPGRYALRWWLDLGNNCTRGKPANSTTEDVGLVIVY